LKTKLKILRIICGPVNDNELGCWARRRNKEIREMTGVPKITNFVKAQRIKWFEHVMKRSGSTLKRRLSGNPLERADQEDVQKIDG